MKELKTQARICGECFDDHSENISCEDYAKQMNEIKERKELEFQKKSTGNDK